MAPPTHALQPVVRSSTLHSIHRAQSLAPSCSSSWRAISHAPASSPPPPIIWPSIRRRLPRVNTDSAMVRPFEPLPDPRETMRNFRKHYGSWKLQQRLRRRRNQTGRGHSQTWRDIFNNLYQRTPVRPPGGPWRYHSHLVVLPQHVAAVLLEDPDDNIWNLYKITDCAFDGAWRSMSTDKVEMLLSGDGTSVSQAFAMMEDICRKHNADAPELYPLPAQEAILEQSNAPGTATAFPQNGSRRGGGAEEPNIWYETSVKSLYADDLFSQDPSLSISCFEDVPQPTTTRSSLCRYLHSLYRAKIPPNKSIKAYGSLSEQHRALWGILSDLLDRASRAGALSETSFGLAFRLLTKYSAPAKLLDEFIRKMETVYQTPAVGKARLWNIYLERHIATHDLERFAGIVTRMAHRGVVPNRRTWHLFIQLVEDNTVKRIIVNGMYRKGLMGERRTTMLVAEELSMHHASLACKLGLDLDQFMRLQALRLSPAWISPHTINNVVEGFCRYGRFDDCFRLLEYAYDPLMAQPTYPDSRPFFLIAYHARLQLNVAAFAKAVESVQRTSPAMLTSMFYDEMFLFALRGRCPALLAETWIFACVNRKLTRRIAVPMAKNFQWLVARLLRDHRALPFDAHPASRANTLVAPVFLESVADAVIRKYRRRGQDPSAILRDASALLAECVAVTRSMHQEHATTTTYNIGDRISDIMADDQRSVGEWRDDPTVDNAQRLGMIPLGIFADDHGGGVIDTDAYTVSAGENSEADDEGPAGMDHV